MSKGYISKRTDRYRGRLAPSPLARRAVLPPRSLLSRVSAPARHLMLGALLVAGLALGGGASAGAATGRHHRSPRTVNARVSARFVMQGRIVTAVRVKGERRGQRVTRQWTITPSACKGSVCRHLVLTRERSANQFDHLVLSRTGVGRYAGN